VLCSHATAESKTPRAANNRSLLDRGSGNANADQAEGAVERAIIVGEGLSEAEYEIVLAAVAVPALNTTEQVGGVVNGQGFTEEVVESIEDTEGEVLLDNGSGRADSGVLTVEVVEHGEVLDDDAHEEVKLFGFFGECGLGHHAKKGQTKNSNQEQFASSHCII